MQEYHPTDDLKSLLRQFREIGGMVDFVLIENDLDVEAELLHRIVALFGMKLIQARWVEADIQSRTDADSANTPFQPITIFPNARHSRSETISIFLQDYWYLFSQPPYGLRQRDSGSGEFIRVPEGEVQELFSQINLLIFGEFSNWWARRWSTDWSNYFLSNQQGESGHLWTLLSTNGAHCVWIGCRTDRFFIE